jgi:hypothetical protein
MTDGCVHLLYNSSWEFHQLAAGQLLSTQPVHYGKDRRYGPSLTCKITPAGSLSSSQPGGPPCWANPLAFGLIGTNQTNVRISALHYSYVAQAVGRVQGVHKPGSFSRGLNIVNNSTWSQNKTKHVADILQGPSLLTLFCQNIGLEKLLQSC